MSCDEYGHIWTSGNSVVPPGTPCDCGGVTWEGNELERLAAADATIARLTEERDRLKAKIDELCECASIWCPYEKRMHEAEASLRVLHEGIRELHVEMRDYVSRPECNRFDIQRWIDRLARLGSPGQESHV